MTHASQSMMRLPSGEMLMWACFQTGVTTGSTPSARRCRVSAENSEELAHGDDVRPERSGVPSDLPVVGGHHDGDLGFEARYRSDDVLVSLAARRREVHA